jgi:hypothetical protein
VDDVRPEELRHGAGSSPGLSQGLVPLPLCQLRRRASRSARKDYGGISTVCVVMSEELTEGVSILAGGVGDGIL